MTLRCNTFEEIVCIVAKSIFVFIIPCASFCQGGKLKSLEDCEGDLSYGPIQSMEIRLFHNSRAKNNWFYYSHSKPDEIIKLSSSVLFFQKFNFRGDITNLKVSVHKQQKPVQQTFFVHSRY